MDYGRGGRGERGYDDRSRQQNYGPRGGSDRQRDRDDDDRGFFDRAGDEVRSWFGDDEASRRRDQDGRFENDDDRRGGYQTYGDRAFGNRERHDSRGGQDERRPSSGQRDDVHGYGNWRQRQIEQLDRDYDEFRREHQSQFDTQFASWREKRTGQRSSLGKVTEHMEVVGSDGQHIGTVDKVRGDRIILTKSDPEAGGRHHSIPCSWIETVEDKVTVNKSHDEAQRQWKDEERSGAMFGDDQQQSQRTTGNYARSGSGDW